MSACRSAFDCACETKGTASTTAIKIPANNALRVSVISLYCTAISLAKRRLVWIVRLALIDMERRQYYLCHAIKDVHDG